MHQIIERAMTEKERKRLLDCMPLAPSPFRSRQFKLRLIAELIGVVVAVVFLVYFRKQPAAFVIPVAVGLFALWWLFQLKSRILTPSRKWREANQRMLGFHDAVTSAQIVSVHCVEAATVVQVTYDEGTLCLFDVGQSQTYWMDPSCMIPGRPPKDWPNQKFEVVEVPGWKEELGPFCEGKRLRPRQTFEFHELFEHYEFEPPADGVIHQTLDAFIAEAKTRNQKVGATCFPT
jgi:hypothetical protein